MRKKGRKKKKNKKKRRIRRIRIKSLFPLPLLKRQKLVSKGNRRKQLVKGEAQEKGEDSEDDNDNDSDGDC